MLDTRGNMSVLQLSETMSAGSRCASRPCSDSGGAMDCYDRAAMIVEERRERAVAEVLAAEYVQRVHWERRVDAGLAGICEDCGEMIDTTRVQVHATATTCRVCARSED